MLNLKQEIKSKFSLAVILIAFCLSAGSFLFYYFATEPNFNWQSDLTHNRQPRSRRWLDGELVLNEKARLKPLALMIENHVDSRPPAGLDSASIIYETIVEGDITRFLAIFDNDIKAKKIGPIRSVRPFFVKLAEEWNPIFFHAGGSAEALALLKQNQMASLNEISADGIYFWRDQNRIAPHNLFTSSDLIQRAVLAKEIKIEADFSPWLFKKDSLKTIASDSETIEINFLGNPDYQVSYKYNVKDNNYTRYLGNKIHKTEKGVILKANNIVVQHVKSRIIDDYGRLNVDLQSGGQAEVYQDGRKIEGVWRRQNQRTRFYTKDRQEIEFNRGVIWIELIAD